MNSTIEFTMLKCPVCENYYEVEEDNIRHIGEICPICFWQYDVVGQEQVEIAIGPNKVSLVQARKIIQILGLQLNGYYHM